MPGRRAIVRRCLIWGQRRRLKCATPSPNIAETHIDERPDVCVCMTPDQILSAAKTIPMARPMSVKPSSAAPVHREPLRLACAAALSALCLTAAAPTAAAQSSDGQSCDYWAGAWTSGVGATSDAVAMVQVYLQMPRGCVAERAEALLRIGQVARQTGYVLEASADGSPVVRRPTPPPPPPPPPRPVLTDADLVAQPGRRDFANPPEAMRRLTGEVVVVVRGILRDDGAFDWSLQSETPAGAGMSNYALRLAEKFRSRTTRSDGAPLVGGVITRTFRFKATT